MSTQPAAPLIAQEAATLRRPGRALIGWTKVDEGAIALAGGSASGRDRPELRAQVEAARTRVLARPPGVDQNDVVDESHPALPSILTRLKNQGDTVAFWNESWSVAVVDLARICSLQQSVASGQASERVADIDQDDIESIANVTMPPPSTNEVPAQFDQIRGAWIISAPNPNLRITGPFAGQVQPGVFGFGFTVGVLASFLQVARHHGRWVLRDGYHRAYGLLARGITHAPAFVRDFGVGDLGTGQGLFQTDVYLGERPPTLKDFLDDTVAATVNVPIVQKMIVVHGLELSPLA